MVNQEEFLKQLRDAFAVESQEHLQIIASGLLALEATEGEPDQEGLETTYRAAHSLKGAARAVDMKDIEYICHSMEGVFLALKRADIRPTPSLLDTLHEALHLIERQRSGSAVAAADVRAICETLDRFAHKDSPQSPLPNPLQEQLPREPPSAPQPSTPAPVPSSARPETSIAQQPPPSGSERNAEVASTIRVHADRLDTVLRKSENLIAVKQLHAQLLSQLKSVLAQLEEAGADHQARQHSIRALSTLVNRLASESVHASTLIDSLIEEAQSMLMLPCSALFDSFPVAARDIAKSLGKEVGLDISGQTIELEKRILEKLKDPLMHMLRNAIDHGIEPPTEREAHGKPRRGQIAIRVAHLDSRHIEIIVSDDGRGIDPAQIRRTVLARHLMSEAEVQKKKPEELYAFLFESGFSTSEIVTDLSGRGLGLAIVKHALDELEGSVHIESESGKGTSFHLVIPYTKASFKGNFIRVGDRTFVIPSSALEKGLRIPQHAIATAGSANVVEYQDKTISIVHLGDMLGIPRALEMTSPDHVLAMVCRSGEKVCAFIVDDILGEQDVLIKPLGELLHGVRGMYGATIGANDEVIPILNMREIIKMAYENAAPEKGALDATSDAEAHETRPRHILVVEDSITSRTLISSILSSAGYEVRAATDGIEGYTLLKSEPFDLVVSDVEMPRLDGFGLTERIRNDAALARIPVVLVTALESKEHKEKGIAVGANAYITKRNFAQSNLLDTVRRFL